MSLRCIWVLNLSKADFGKILLYRQFPTVEKRCETTYEEFYVPPPPPLIFGNKLLVRLGLSPDSKQYVEWRDKANGLMQLPVVEVIINNKELWPLVAIVQGSLLVCCLPYVENRTSITKDNLLKVPSISVGFAVLLGVLNFLTNTDLSQSSLIDLENYLLVTMPFGTPSDVDLSSATYLQKYHTQKLIKQQPAWKPFDHKGKQVIHFKITEFVRSVQSEQSEAVCHFETFGQVSVKADVEGSMNEIGISIVSTDVGHALALDSVIMHPCVNALGGPSALGSGLPKRLRFSPPLHEFVLFQYCSIMPKEPPISGVFKMLGENSADLVIQLKLSDKVKNNFEYCDLIVVFFNRGPVRNMEFNASYGSPRLSDDKYSLKWSIGSKFPKDLEANLTAKLEFQDEPILSNSDPFCVEKNCFAQINFKQSNSTLSGCNIDQKSITASEGSKPKVFIERSVQSAEYRLWNNFGDLPFPVHIVNKFNKVFS